MRVSESLVVGKSPDPELCEDAVVTTDSFIAVIDGATDKTGKRYAGVAGGRFACDVLRDGIAQLDPNVTAREAVAELSGALADALARAAPNPRDGDRPTATALIFSARRREIWRVGADNTYRVSGRSHTRRKRIEEIAARARAALLQELLLKGTSEAELSMSDPGRELILPILENEYLFRNSALPGWGYAALDGTAVPDKFIEVVAAPQSEDIVFATDGYPRVFDTLEETERFLRRSLSRDPLRIRSVPATKGCRPGQHSYDDRAYVRFSLKK